MQHQECSVCYQKKELDTTAELQRNMLKAWRITLKQGQTQAAAFVRFDQALSLRLNESQQKSTCVMR